MNPKLIDKLAWIYIKDRKLLHARSLGKDTWYIPGGKREKGETDQKALLREVAEELSVELLPHTLKLLGIFKAQAHGKPKGVMVQMTCYTGEFDGKIKPGAEIEEIMWLDSKPTVPIGPVDVLILDYLKKNDLID